ncbi:MAG: YicC family protein [Syntrophobacterales bacterium]|nr:YicC family protein [Syntrophobacterales bacterium]
MLTSMTGMIRHSINEEGYLVTCEIRSLNSKHLDVNVRIPKAVSICEESIRSLVKSKLRRGRIDLYINIESPKGLRSLPKLDHYAFRTYWNELTLLSKVIPNLGSPTLQDVLSIPYVFDTSPAEKEEEKEEWLCRLMTKVCEEGLENLLEMKRHEGMALEAICEGHLRIIEKLLEEIDLRRENVVITIRERMKERVNKLLSDLSIRVDDHLILQEIAILADRMDISEELSRLRAHVAHFRSIAFSDKELADGRQLDFIVQEMHREANTMGSKASDLIISEIVVALKTEIAKLREQVQNIE